MIGPLLLYKRQLQVFEPLDETVENTLCRFAALAWPGRRARGRIDPPCHVGGKKGKVRIGVLHVAVATEVQIERRACDRQV